MDKKLNKSKSLKQIRKEVKIVEKAIEKFFKEALECTTEKDFILVNL